MFITPTNRSHDRHGQQVARGRFLMLVQPDSGSGHLAPLRAIVRPVRLEQLGHFMMGLCTAYGHELSISGTYGGDGLPMSVPQAVYDHATPVPTELIEAWNKGGGWNSAGSEAPAMRDWALKAFPRNTPETA